MTGAQLTLVTGGARSGKSHHAEQLARTAGGDDVRYVATLAVGDDEMARRVADHRSRRPASWRTVEAPTAAEVAAAVRTADDRVVLLDCLSGMISAVVLAHGESGEAAVHEHTARAVDALLVAVDGTAATDVVVVTNEVGDGVVPAHALGRWFRDALGTANRRVAAHAERVVLVTVGIPMVIKDTGDDE